MHRSLHRIFEKLSTIIPQLANARSSEHFETNTSSLHCIGAGRNRAGEETLCKKESGNGRQTGLSSDRGYKWAKQRSVRMPRARLQVAWPPINMSAGNTMPRHTTPFSHPRSPSGSPGPPSHHPAEYLCSPDPGFSPLFHPRRAHLNIMEMSSRDSRGPRPRYSASVIHLNEHPGVVSHPSDPGILFVATGNLKILRLSFSEILSIG